MAPIRKRAARVASADPRGKYPPPQGTLEAASHPHSDSLPVSNPKAEKYAGGHAEEPWHLSKRDKRTVRHNALLSRVREAGVHKRTAVKRRRPGNKLHTTLNDLGDALPDTDQDLEEDGWEEIEDDATSGETTGLVFDPSTGLPRSRRRTKPSRRMQMKSLPHRAGAMKKKHALEGVEMDRFKRNLAQMTSRDQSASADAVSQIADHSNHADRWAALRRFIGSTMVEDKAFSKS